MTRTIETPDIIESARLEILFAVKERITELTKGTTAPVQLNRVVIRNPTRPYHDSLNYFDVQNVYIDERDRLCGDLVGKDDRISNCVLFGKEMEHLEIDDLKRVLDSLYGSHCTVDLAGYDQAEPRHRDGLHGFFTAGREGISRIIRRGA